MRCLRTTNRSHAVRLYTGFFRRYFWNLFFPSSNFTCTYNFTIITYFKISNVESYFYKLFWHSLPMSWIFIFKTNKGLFFYKALPQIMSRNQWQVYLRIYTMRPSDMFIIFCNKLKLLMCLHDFLYPYLVGKWIKILHKCLLIFSRFLHPFFTLCLTSGMDTTIFCSRLLKSNKLHFPASGSVSGQPLAESHTLRTLYFQPKGLISNSQVHIKSKVF